MTEDLKSKPDSFWKEKLTEEQFRVCRAKGTERPFSGEYHDLKEKGVYRCVCCREELFASDAKFDSGTGWPSFYDPVNKDSLELENDYKLLIKRTEVLCKHCGSHLGHVFDDGPPPTGKRFCINSVALFFCPETG